jgi:hypothetical protein
VDNITYQAVTEAIIAELRTIVGDTRVLVDRDVFDPNRILNPGKIFPSHTLSS